MNIQSARFAASAARAGDEPREPGPHVVFFGRSNVGKSSLINRLLGVRGLARTSSTPGRTQTVNYYRVNESIWFIDLPGYGWARAPEAVRRAWRPMVEGWLGRRRASIAAAVLVLDARHAPTALDRTMRDFLVASGLAGVAVGTKADKLSGIGRDRAARALAAFVEEEPLAGPVLVSAVTGLGIREVWRHLDAALEAAPVRSEEGRRWTSRN